jgi:cytochrome P450
LIGKDAPDHTVIRQALLPHFSMRGLSDIGAYIEQCAQDLLKPAISRNEFDIVKEFAMPLADLVMGHVLGLTVEEVNSLQRSIDSNRYQPSYFSSLERFFSDYAKTRDGKSEDHFLQRLVHAAGTKELGEAEIVSLLKLLWIGGTTTTSALISTSVQIFLYHHAVAYEIQNDSDLVPQFVEEALRFDPPEQMVARVTLQETQVAGCSIPLNAQVRLCLGAANRDPKHYMNPDLFILSRNPKDHLAFGAGAHYCLGAVLGRLEAQIALKTLLQLCPRVRASQPAQSAPYIQSDQFRALEKLMVRVRN